MTQWHGSTSFSRYTNIYCHENIKEYNVTISLEGSGQALSLFAAAYGR